MGEAAERVYELRVLVRPGLGGGMPPAAVGGEALCLVGAPDRAAPLRTAFAELTGRGYACEELVGHAALPVDPERWAERAAEIRGDLSERFHGSGEGLPGAADVRRLAAEGGFLLAACFCWEAEPPPRAAGGPADGPDRPRRKRRRRAGRGPEPRPSLLGVLASPAAVAPLLVACLWATLFWLTLARSLTPYWFGCCGVAAFLGGGAWAVWAARADGVELFTPWEGTGVIALFQALMQLISLPVVSWVHLRANFAAAWPPAAVLLMGAGMTASAVLLARHLG